VTQRRYFVRRGAQEFALDVELSAPGRFRVRVAGRPEPIEVSVLRGSAPTAVLARGRPLDLYRLTSGELVLHPTREELRVSERRARVAPGESATESGRVLAAPMPGRVVKVLVAEGATVSLGEPVIVIEAMKMENELLAPRAGVVQRVHVEAGDAVERDAPLLELE